MRRLGALFCTVVTVFSLTGCEPFTPSVEPETAIGMWHTIIDGDTAEIWFDGDDLPEGLESRERVRILGIDTPELDACGGLEAKEFPGIDPLDALFIVLVGDPYLNTRDEYGRLLVYLETRSGTDIGLHQITTGNASAWYPKDGVRPSRIKEYQAAQNQAEKDQVGSWATCETVGR